MKQDQTHVVFLHSLLLLSSSFTLDYNNIIYNEKFHAKKLQDSNNAPFWRHKRSSLKSGYVNLVAPKKINAPTTPSLIGPNVIIL
jgi:hypothetical protein